ncbi:hypothetical protein ALC53_09217 [Atta colombica]|uniref:Uncharacterized protein n=1 Tax=Atta colombica TaxID=520822 RepID=A0A195B6H8_9HYME|nr:hypothetical protein ALC53_09217 [Atta colombica]
MGRKRSGTTGNVEEGQKDASKFVGGTESFGSGSMVAHMEPAQRICYDNAANDLPWAFVMLNCGSIRTP